MHCHPLAAEQRCRCETPNWLQTHWRIYQNLRICMITSFLLVWRFVKTFIFRCCRGLRLWVSVQIVTFVLSMRSSNKICPHVPFCFLLFPFSFRFCVFWAFAYISVNTSFTIFCLFVRLSGLRPGPVVGAQPDMPIAATMARISIIVKLLIISILQIFLF